ncbi:MAG: hypothetical protein AAF456_01645 [Planctomycetota bacterium]
MNNDQIQLLVDGQLDHDERSRLLRSLADDSSQWREVALAFIESQILNEALNFDDMSAMVRAEKQPVQDDVRLPSSRRTPWIAIAVSLAAGLLCGFLMFRGPAPEAVTQSDPAPVVNNTESNADPDSIPLEEALARSARPVSLDARRELLRAGYFIDEIREVADVELPTGKLIKMPVREFKVHYLGNAAYQ